MFRLLYRSDLKRRYSEESYVSIKQRRSRPMLSRLRKQLQFKGNSKRRHLSDESKVIDCRRLFRYLGELNASFHNALLSVCVHFACVSYGLSESFETILLQKRMMSCSHMDWRIAL